MVLVVINIKRKELCLIVSSKKDGKVNGEHTIIDWCKVESKDEKKVAGGNHDTIYIHIYIYLLIIFVFYLLDLTPPESSTTSMHLQSFLTSTAQALNLEPQKSLIQLNSSIHSLQYYPQTLDWWQENVFKKFYFYLNTFNKKKFNYTSELILNYC